MDKEHELAHHGGTEKGYEMEQSAGWDQGLLP